LWTAGILAGAALGYVLIKQAVITRAEAPRSLYRQADYTALPFMMLAFGVKYVLGVMSAVSPQTMQQPAMSALAIVSGGVFAGVFIGKFARYVGVYVRPGSGLMHQPCRRSGEGARVRGAISDVMQSPPSAIEVDVIAKSPWRSPALLSRIGATPVDLTQHTVVLHGSL
jgi:hypothetical protein